MTGPPRDTAQPEILAPYEPLAPDVLARLVISAVSEGILVHEEGRILQVTPTLARMFGYEEYEMVGLMGPSLTIPSDRMRLLAHIATEAEVPLEGTALRRDGTTFPVEVTARSVMLDGRRLRIALVRDITERRRIELERASHDARARAIMRQLPAVVWTTDRELRLTFIEGLLAAPDREADPRLGEPVSALVAAHADPSVAIAAHERALAGESAAYVTQRRGTVFDVNVEPLLAPDNSIVGVVGVAVDISAEMHAWEAARKSQERFNEIVSRIPEIFWVAELEPEPRIAYMSPGFERVFHLPVSRMYQDLRAYLERVHPEDRVLVEATLRPEVLAADVTTDYRILLDDGTIRWIRHRRYPIANDEGKVTRLVGITEDITETLNAREALRASEARFRALVEHAADLIAILDPDGVNLYASPSHQRVLGIAAGELHGRSCFDFVHPDDAAALRAQFDRAMRRSGPTPPQVIRFRGHGEGYCSLEVVLTDMRDEPAVGGIVANSRDVSEQMRLEAQLRQAQKMEAVGQLAGGVAHDFNNILATVSGYAEALAQELPPDDPRHADAREIVQAAARGASVAKQLLAFGRPQAVETEVLDLAAVVRETGRMLRPLLPATIAVELPAPNAAPVHVRASRSQLEQIVVNLAVNARDAMPEGGTLAFVASREGAAGREPSAVLRVTDTGIGMSRDVQERIFDPFFTTKPPGQGTGLGLSTVYGLVRRFGGQVMVDSAPGSGTTFRLTFPLAAAAAADDVTSATRDAASAPAPAPRAPTTESRRILLAEDEVQLRNVTRRILERQGYAVTAVEHGGAALEHLDAGEHCDLVLTDAAMPVMGGAELARAIAARHPGLPVILMSGYAELTGATGAEGSNPPGVAEFVEKPYRVDHLLEVVARVLAASA